MTAIPSEIAERFRAEPPREICIVMMSAIGDAVHVLPVVNALKRTWPETRITWIIQPVPRILAQGHPAVDEFVVFERRRGLDAWRGFHELSRQLRERRFDLALGLQVYFKAGLITAFVPARVRVGFDFRRARDLNWLFTNERIPLHENQHVQDQYFEFLEHIGVDPRPVEWRIPITDSERRDQEEFFRKIDGPACAVVVGTSKLEKNWTAEGYARVIDELERVHGLRPVLIGGPSAVERTIADEIERLSGARIVDTLGDDLRKAIWILDGAALCISPDTGPLHISRALDTPVVGLYGYTNPRRSGPYGKFQDLVVDGYAEHPGEEYPINMEYRDGMKRVTADAVLEKVKLAVDRYI